MGLRVRNDLSGTRALIVIALVCLEAFLGPISGILSMGLWPTPVQVANYGATAALQGITLLIGFFERV